MLNLGQTNITVKMAITVLSSFNLVTLLIATSIVPQQGGLLNATSSTDISTARVWSVVTGEAQAKIWFLN